MTRETALKRGFHTQGKIENGLSIELTRVVFGGVVMAGKWGRFRRDFLDETSLVLPDAMPSYEELSNTGIVVGRDRSRTSWTMSLFDFETLISPGVLVPRHRGAVIVPIKKTYAEELLPEASDQGLLVSPHDVAFRLERAYFLRAGMHTLVPRGTLVVFYVSAGRGQAVALARVTYSETLTRTQAALNLRRQGVLTEEELCERASGASELTAFTFDNIVAFPHGVDFSVLKLMGCVGGANLVTAQRIADESLNRIVSEGFRVNRR